MSDVPVPATPAVVDRARLGAGRTEADQPAAGMVPDYVRRLAWILDDAIPLLGSRRVGLDGFLSLVPVVGDAAGFGLAAVVVLSGVRAGCSWITIVRMLFHAVGESMVGMVPIAGPAVAFVWKANQRNLGIIERNLADREATRRESWKVLLVALALAVLTIGVALIGLVVAVYTIFRWVSG